MRKVLFFVLVCLMFNIQMIMAHEKITQTAGHVQLGEFAPKFAELNDDVPFAPRPQYGNYLHTFRKRAD